MFEEKEEKEINLNELIEIVERDPIPNNVFTVEKTDNLVLLGKINEVVANLNSINNLTQSSNNQSISALNTALNALTIANDSITGSATALENSQTALNTANTAISTANASLEQATNADNKSNTALEQSTNAVSTAQNALDKITNNLGTLITRNNTQLTTYDITHLESQVENINNQLPLVALKTDVNNVLTVVNQTSSDLNDLTSQFNEMSSDVDNMSTVINQTSIDLSELSTQFNGLLNKIYPVGSLYLSINDVSPASFIGGNWEKLSGGYALWTASSGAGSTIEPGLPNITGTFCGGDTDIKSGAFISSVGNGSKVGSGSAQFRTFTFNANNGASVQGIYGNSETVQPPSYKVYAWRRTN